MSKRCNLVLVASPGSGNQEIQEIQESRERKRETGKTGRLTSSEASSVREREFALSNLQKRGTLSDFVRWSLENMNHYGPDLDGLVREPDEAFADAMRVWGFARLVKGHPLLGDGEPMSALRQITPLMRGTLLSESNCPWRSHFDLNSVDGEALFCDAWEKIEHPAKPHPVALACWKVQVGGPAAFPTQRPPDYLRFVAMIGWLQEAQRIENITLPRETVAPFFPCAPMTVARYAGFAERDGFLTKVREANWRAGLAIEYRGVRIDDIRLGLDMEKVGWLLEFPEYDHAEVVG